ncbi:Nitrogen regulatory protein PII [Clostridium bornimense]|uniref:Nitrogen regulatory protein PII n=1 Tax=Clostridium bornimense TaxID=1216932 RepID=W6S051_9CLOT|nr:P-II family nitrogen regulator [Clostridium bornimense]CDM70286.1 Nitrogen regulatory protein PII [Clostridium bornimense]
MKEVIMFIRPKMYFETKKALNDGGFHSMTVKDVVGRGRTPIHYDLDGEGITRNRLVAKKMVDMYIRDEDVEKVIDIVIEANKTNHAGDGKMFILPVREAIRIRTEQKGEEALV